MFISRLLLVSAALPLVAACSGGVVGTDPVAARNALATEYNTLTAYGSAPVVNAGQLTGSGTATYDGVMRVQVDTITTTEVLGEAAVNVNFAADTVNASFGNFYGRANGQPVTAWAETTQVTATGGLNTASGSIIQTVLNGRIEDPDGDWIRFNNLGLNGNFRDTAPTFLDEPDALILQSGPGNIIFNGVGFATETGNNCETCVWVVAED